MRIIQSFWSLPITGSHQAVYNNRFIGGWLHMKYHLMSWTYSCLQLRSFYDEVELITDRNGKRLLIDDLGLPYSKTSIALDILNGFDPDLWALGKIYAFSLQETPFIHVDGDIFIWERFSKRIEEAELVAQNLEYNFPFYKEVLLGLMNTSAYIPEVILNNYKSAFFISAFNAGIIGGNNIPFFRDYVYEALKLVHINQDRRGNISSGMFNAFYEQHLYYCMARKKKVRVECYTDSIREYELNTDLKGLLQFRQAPASTGYIHLFGDDAKKDVDICEELARKLRNDYPEYYERVLHVAHQVNNKEHALNNKYEESKLAAV